MRMKVSWRWCRVVVIAISKAFSSALSMFGRPGSLSAIRRLLVGL